MSNQREHWRWNEHDSGLYEYRPDPVAGEGAYIRVGTYPMARNKAEAIKMHTDDGAPTLDELRGHR